MTMPPPGTVLPFTVHSLQDLVGSLTVDLEDRLFSPTPEDLAIHAFYERVLPYLSDTDSGDVARLQGLQTMIGVWLAGEPSTVVREYMRGIVWYLEHRVIPVAGR